MQYVGQTRRFMNTRFINNRFTEHYRRMKKSCQSGKLHDPCVCTLITMTEPRHKISNNVVCATSKGSDQPAHTRRLIIAVSSHFNIP